MLGLPQSGQFTCALTLVGRCEMSDAFGPPWGGWGGSLLRSIEYSPAFPSSAPLPRRVLLDLKAGAPRFFEGLFLTANFAAFDADFARKPFFLAPDFAMLQTTFTFDFDYNKRASDAAYDVNNPPRHARPI
jgi:hypothetical protein